MVPNFSTALSSIFSLEGSITWPAGVQAHSTVRAYGRKDPKTEGAPSESKTVPSGTKELGSGIRFPSFRFCFFVFGLRMPSRVLTAG